MYKIIHYRSKCIGCGVCYELQPELWRMSKKDGKARLLKGICKKNIYILDIPHVQVVQVHKTAEACPVKIIKVL